MNDDYEELFKILILGDSGVGKTNLLSRYCNNVFGKDTKATIGVDFDFKYYNKNGKTYKAQIFDTAGQERFKSVIKGFFNGTHGVVLVYDITSKKSFESIKNWFNDCKENIRNQFSCILIGNKNDLDNRQVSTHEGEEMAKSLQLPFMEVSAKTADNVEKAFEALLDVIYEKYKDSDDFEDINPNDKNIKFEDVNNRKDNKKCC